MGRGEQLTIDDLAATTGVSSRSIRYYQTRGLLPPPKVKGRQGFYGERHIERLRLITELAEEGLNLQAIGWLLGGARSVDSEELRQLKRAVLDSWAGDEPMVVTADELGTAFTGGEVDGEAVERAVELGLFEDAGDGRVRVLLPSVLAAGGELADMGLPPGRMLEVLARMREAATDVARAYVEVFDEGVLAPWDARGRPDDEWPKIREAVDRIRPLAGEALLAVFRQVMVDVVAEMMGGVVDPSADQPTA